MFQFQHNKDFSLKLNYADVSVLTYENKEQSALLYLEYFYGDKKRGNMGKTCKCCDMSIDILYIKINVGVL